MPFSLHKASYAGGNLTDVLTFRYTVVEGDDTDTFDILDTRTTRRQKFSTALVRPAAAEVSTVLNPYIDTRGFPQAATIAYNAD